MLKSPYRPSADSVNSDWATAAIATQASSTSANLAVKRSVSLSTSRLIRRTARSFSRSVRVSERIVRTAAGATFSTPRTSRRTFIRTNSS